MIIHIAYKYSQRGIIAQNHIEEEIHCCDTETALNAICACLRHLKKCGDGAIHATVDGRTLSAYPNSYDDWQNGIVVYCESERRNRATETNIPFSSLKKLFRDWLNASATI